MPTCTHKAVEKVFTDYSTKINRLQENVQMIREMSHNDPTIQNKDDSTWKKGSQTEYASAGIIWSLVDFMEQQKESLLIEDKTAIIEAINSLGDINFTAHNSISSDGSEEKFINYVKDRLNSPSKQCSIDTAFNIDTVGGHATTCLVKDSSNGTFTIEYFNGGYGAHNADSGKVYGNISFTVKCSQEDLLKELSVVFGKRQTLKDENAKKSSLEASLHAIEAKNSGNSKLYDAFILSKTNELLKQEKKIFPQKAGNCTYYSCNATINSIFENWTGSQNLEAKFLSYLVGQDNKKDKITPDDLIMKSKFVNLIMTEIQTGAQHIIMAKRGTTAVTDVVEEIKKIAGNKSHHATTQNIIIANNTLNIIAAGKRKGGQSYIIFKSNNGESIQMQANTDGSVTISTEEKSKDNHGTNVDSLEALNLALDKYINGPSLSNDDTSHGTLIINKVTDPIPIKQQQLPINNSQLMSTYKVLSIYGPIRHSYKSHKPFQNKKLLLQNNPLGRNIVYGIPSRFIGRTLKQSSKRWRKCAYNINKRLKNRTRLSVLIKKKIIRKNGRY